MSSPPRRSLQTRGRNSPARNALHPPRGARSAFACRALSGAPAPARARQSGLPRGPRAGRGGSGTLRQVARAGQRGPPPRPAIPRRPPVGHHRGWRRHHASGTAVPRRRRRPRGGPLAHRGPRSTTNRASVQPGNRASVQPDVRQGYRILVQRKRRFNMVMQCSRRP